VGQAARALPRLFGETFGRGRLWAGFSKNGACTACAARQELTQRFGWSLEAALGKDEIRRQDLTDYGGALANGTTRRPLSPAGGQRPGFPDT
jgi:hypothetical protein